MKILPTTTLGELELRLRSFGLTCTVHQMLDGRVGCEVIDMRAIRGYAVGASLDEAIDAAINTYQTNAFGPKPSKEQLS